MVNSRVLMNSFGRLIGCSPTLPDGAFNLLDVVRCQLLWYGGVGFGTGRNTPMLNWSSLALLTSLVHVDIR